MWKHVPTLLVAWSTSLTTALAQPPEDRLVPPDRTLANGATTMDPSCNYDRCALRLTLNFGTWKIVRGVEGVQVGTLGLLRAPNLEPLVAEVPEAAREARELRRSYARSSALLWGGAGIAALGSIAAIGQSGHAAGVAVGFGGVAIMLLGARQYGKSVDVVSRSIWLYNRSLSR
jgi:hypothetical protein